ncbi:MAG: histidine kinase [Lewinellaceae bacterium]|nr:histidine kinase [Lewinellaceae bacterium]
MKQNYQWIVLGCGVAMLVISNMVGYLTNADIPPERLPLIALVVLLGISSHWLAVYLIARYFQRRFGGHEQIRKRLVLSLVWGTLAMWILFQLTDALLWGLTHQEPYRLAWDNLVVIVSQTVVTSIFILGLAEAFYQYQLVLVAEREREELSRINLLAQYDTLKQQVNPHFLFNSLNSLSSLISIDPDKAEKFVEEMSVVYRYLLQSSQEELVTLQEEFHFLSAYLHLLQTRFGMGLQTQFTVDEEYLSRRLPPLTLQLLVENAVKHNEVSEASPLFLTLETTAAGELQVRNNLQRKKLTVPSAQVGLANIMAKYRLLKQPPIVVEETNLFFTVTIPLL